MGLKKILVIATALISIFYAGLTQVSSNSDSIRVLLEKEAEAAYAKIRFIAPTGQVSRSRATWSMDEQLVGLRDSSQSSFLVFYRGRLFLLTASHVWSNLEPNVGYRAANIDGTWRHLPERKDWRFMTSADLAAIEITDTDIDRRLGGILKPGTDDLTEGKSLLFLACNYIRFAPYFVGVFGGLDSRFIKISFLGDGVKAGCSGSPVIDKNDFIRGLIVRGSGNALGQVTGEIGFAVKSDEIIEFLNLKFFSN